MPNLGYDLFAGGPALGRLGYHEICTLAGIGVHLLTLLYRVYIETQVIIPLLQLIYKIVTISPIESGFFV